MESKRNDGDYENDNELEMGSLPNFIPKGAPDVKPPEAVADPQPAGGAEAPQNAGDAEAVQPLADAHAVQGVGDGEPIAPAAEAESIQPAADAASPSAYDEALKQFISTGKQGHTEKYGRELLDGILAEIASGKGSDPRGQRAIHSKLVHYGFAAWDTAPQIYSALSEEHAQRAVVDQEAKQGAQQDALSKGAPAPEAAAASAVAPNTAPTAAVLADVSKALLAAVQDNAAAQGANVQQVVRSGQPGAPMSGGGAEAAQSGLRSLAEGGLGLVGGLASLAGTVGRGVGGAARTLASAVEARRQAGASFADAAPRVAPGISVLPKITAYRAEQAEKMANAYQNSLDKFWASGKLPDVWDAIEVRANETGTTVADVMEKMVPGGELEDLRAQFLDAVGESPDAQESKKGMDRALDSWVRQYGRGSEELLNPETGPGESDEYDSIRDRIEGTQAKMADLVTQSPVFGGEEKSHAQKFRDAIERIAKKIEELLERVSEFIRGRNAAPEQREEPGYEP